MCHKDNCSEPLELGRFWGMRCFIGVALKVSSGSLLWSSEASIREVDPVHNLQTKSEENSVKGPEAKGSEYIRTYSSVHALLNQFMIDFAVLACSEPIRGFVLH